MRFPISVVLLFAAPLLSPAAEDTSLSGKWHVERNAAGNQSQQDCVFTQKGSDLAGSCTNNGAMVDIKGKVDGKNVTWTYKGDSAGGPVTVIYKGALDAPDKIAGTVTAVEFSIEGEFTATRTK